MSARARALLAAGLVACAAPVPGRLSVQVYRGLGGDASGAFLPVVHVLLDATRSMQARGNGGLAQLELARWKARELVAALPPGSRAAIHLLGAEGEAAECAPLEPRAGLAAASDPALLSLLDSVRAAGSEHSIPHALGALAESLRREGRAREVRVVLLTDLDASCGGDWCEAARQLVDAGTWLDVVALGEASAPACLEGLRPSAREPGPLVRALTRPAPGWSLATPGSEADDPRALVGRAGESAIDAPAGSWQLEVALDRPLHIPIQVEPGRLTRVRVLDFSGGPPRFSWEILDERR